MDYHRMPIEIESPEEMGYDKIKINLAESSAFELSLEELGIDLSQIKLEYTHHRGLPALRELIASNHIALHPDQVLLTGGAAMALFIIYTSILNKGDKAGIVFPNYSSNLQVPKAIGCELLKINLSLGDNWRLDVDKVELVLKSGAKLISITSPHNPTGNTLSHDDIHALLKLTDLYDVYFLFDETYRDACFITPYSILASYHRNWISVLSFSKGYGLPGIRIGVIISQCESLNKKFLAAKEMIQICNPPLEESIALAFYQKRESHLQRINARAMQNLQILKNWLINEQRIKCILPLGGLVCFPKLVVKKYEMGNFYQNLFERHGLVVGPGHWFDMPDDYFRLGFGYPTAEKLNRGLHYISTIMDET